MKYSANINGIDTIAYYSEKTIRDLFAPLLKRLSAMHSEKQNRIVVMLAAPPGAGKSTLVSFLEYLARETVPETSFQGVGMDGFHFQQEYLLSHAVSVNGSKIPMVDIKGAPVTFDLEKLTKKVAEVTAGHISKWPYYDRNFHKPVEDAITINSDVVLLEGIICFWIWRAGEGCLNMRIIQFPFLRMKRYFGSG